MQYNNISVNVGKKNSIFRENLCVLLILVGEIDPRSLMENVGSNNTTSSGSLCRQQYFLVADIMPL